MLLSSLRQSGKPFCGQTNRNLEFFMDNVDAVFPRLKRNRTIRLVISTQFNSLHF